MKTLVIIGFPLIYKGFLLFLSFRFIPLYTAILRRFRSQNVVKNGRTCCAEWICQPKSRCRVTSAFYLSNIDFLNGFAGEIHLYRVNGAAPGYAECNSARALHGGAIAAD